MSHEFLLRRINNQPESQHKASLDQRLKNKMATWKPAYPRIKQASNLSKVGKAQHDLKASELSVEQTKPATPPAKGGNSHAKLPSLLEIHSLRRLIARFDRGGNEAPQTDISELREFIKLDPSQVKKNPNDHGKVELPQNAEDRGACAYALVYKAGEKALNSDNKECFSRNNGLESFIVKSSFGKHSAKVAKGLFKYIKKNTRENTDKAFAVEDSAYGYMQVGEGTRDDLTISKLNIFKKYSKVLIDISKEENLLKGKLKETKNEPEKEPYDIKLRLSEIQKQKSDIMSEVNAKRGEIADRTVVILNGALVRLFGDPMSPRSVRAAAKKIPEETRNQLALHWKAIDDLKTDDQNLKEMFKLQSARNALLLRSINSELAIIQASLDGDEKVAISNLMKGMQSVVNGVGVGKKDTDQRVRKAGAHLQNRWNVGFKLFAEAVVALADEKAVEAQAKRGQEILSSAG